MQQEYRTIYEARAKAAGIPRAAAKTGTLAKLYGAGLTRLTEVIGNQATAFARSFAVYRDFLEWQRGRILRAKLEGEIQTIFGWTYHVSDETKPTTLGNFPVQANAGEVTRLAVIKAIEAGLGVCAVVHDALVVECALADVANAVDETRRVMEQASVDVIGFKLDVDAKVVRRRYVDAQGIETWRKVRQILG